MCQSWSKPPFAPGYSAAVQLQGAFLLLVLAAGWAWSGWMRSRECKRQLLACKAAAAASSAYELSGAPSRLPPVAVVMPVKGVRDSSEASWASHLATRYGARMRHA